MREQVKAERRARKAEIEARHEKDSHHWTYPVSYPTSEDLKEINEIRSKLKCVRSAQAAKAAEEADADESLIYPINYPYPTQHKAERAKHLKEKREKEEKEAEIRHHMWE
jgi:hypothetical protein